jgi:2-phosphoglycerate kinase
MKSTEIFKQTIQNYLEQRAQNDKLFTASYAKQDKSIDRCITYILNTVQKSGCNGFADEEIYSMAVHFYDEDDIDAGQPLDCKIVVNHAVELTTEEKDEVRREAIRRVHDEYYNRLKQPQKKVKQTAVNHQLNLFDAL